MRKILFAFLACIAMAVHGQSITKERELKSTDLGNQKLMALVQGNDTVYGMLIKVANRYQKHIKVALGGKDKALKLLNFLLEAKIKGDDIIDLENETHNMVTKNSLGGYLVWSEGKVFSGQLRKPNIRGFIKAIEEFSSAKPDEDDE